MTRNDVLSARIHEIVRWWPLILIPTLIAIAAGIWSVSQQRPTYTATARLEVVPLVQWDEVFLGTSLVRDGGDAKRTATTVAALLDSRQAATAAAEYLGTGWTPESVDDAIKVSVVQDANVIDVVAETADPESAVRLTEGFTKATLEDRWQTIAPELDARIEALSDAVVSSAPGEAATRLQTLKAVRDSGADPTLRMGPSGPATENDRLSVVAVIGLAAAGGISIGVLAAMLMARLRRGPRLADGPMENPVPADEPAFSPNSGS
jgi:capsular polysaccharide biosynthesis protein